MWGNLGTMKAMYTTSSDIRVPTVEEVKASRQAFLTREPRRLFYRVAIELIDLARKGTTSVSVAEALAVLLQTWNASFYRFHGRFDEEHFKQIEALANDHCTMIEEYQQRSITSFRPAEEEIIRVLFTRFEKVLGAVGAAKTLHLLAPSFFPLWDRAIARGYHVNLNQGASDGYIRFMHMAKEQCRILGEQGAPWPDLLKALDEYNYCTYTLRAANT